MLKATELGQGRRTDLVPEEYQVNKPTLADLGIDKKISSLLLRDLLMELANKALRLS